MTVTAEDLRELHRIHRQLTDLRGRIERGPKQIRAGEVNLSRLQGLFKSCKETFTTGRISLDDKQLQLKQREDRIEDLRKKLNVCSTNREYQALVEQIDADENANGVLQDEILEMFEKMDELEAHVSEAESVLAKATEELNKTKSRVTEEQNSLESELSRVQGNLTQAEANLPDDFREDYKRVSKVRGEGTLAQVDGECCGGCYQMITPQMMNELYMSKLVLCKACGCLLYLAEDRAPGS